MPIDCRPSSAAETQVVPLPRNGSSTTSPGCVNNLINHAGSSLGKTALCCLLLDSVAKCKTLLGYASVLPSQLEIFLPKPLPTRELSRCLSVSLSFLSRVFAQSPIGTLTASWYMLKLRVLLNCRSRSQASRKRLGHLPG